MFDLVSRLGYDLRIRGRGREGNRFDLKTFRSTYAARMLRAGFDPRAVQHARFMDPIQRFSLWFGAALDRSPGPWFDPSATALATCDRKANVSARMVLLKKFGPEGFVFYTNYSSRKGLQLSENPQAALVFYWPYLGRQVRIEGTVEPISREESETYFHSRPRASQLAASVSKQSEVIPSRKFLIDRFRRLEEQLVGQTVPLPATWGGYRLMPGVFEFWRHRDNRLHDRLRYRRADGKWITEFLAP